jgi:hypothetical protein
MKRSLWILRVVLVGALVSPGCGGGPTSSIGNGSGTGSSSGGGSSSDLNLTGTWTGTIQFYKGSCPAAPVSVVLTQADSAGVNGTHFSGGFEIPCGGPIQISGILNAGHLYGSVSDPTGDGRLTGTASKTDIQIRTLQGQGGPEGGQEVINAIQLHR